MQESTLSKFFFTFKSSIFFLGPAHTIQLKRQCQTKGPRIAIRWRKSNTSVLIFRQSLVKFTTCTISCYCQNCLEFFKIQKLKGLPYQLANPINPLTTMSDQYRFSPYNIKQTSDEKKKNIN